jgi:microcystin-dependent protein
MATVTASYNWVSGETVTPAKLNTTAAPTVVVADNEVTTAKILDANVTDAKLAATLNLSSKTVTLPATISLPAGAVMSFAMNSAPAGWLAADGSNVNRMTYAALFSAIGTTYGAGDGSTTFALPDLRGYFVRGSGTNSDGTAAGTFGAKQADDFKSHNHTSSTVVVRNLAPTPTGFGVTASGGNMDPNNTVTTTSVGGTETRPANIALLYCIKF